MINTDAAVTIITLILLLAGMVYLDHTDPEKNRDEQ